MWRKFISLLGLITCGYGEKWYYGVYTSFATIFGVSFLYMSGLKLPNGRVIQYVIDPTFKGFTPMWDKLVDYCYSLYFSMMTFITADGNIQAVGTLSHIVSFIQMFLGVILIAIITGSILRKLFR